MAPCIAEAPCSNGRGPSSDGWTRSLTTARRAWSGGVRACGRDLVFRGGSWAGLGATAFTRVFAGPAGGGAGLFFAAALADVEAEREAVEWEVGADLGFEVALYGLVINSV